MEIRSNIITSIYFVHYFPSVHFVWQTLRSELDAKQTLVLTLAETVYHLCLNDDRPEVAGARDRSRVVSQRLQSLLLLTDAYIESLESKLDVKVGVSVSCCNVSFNNFCYALHSHTSG